MSSKFKKVLIFASIFLFFWSFSNLKAQSLSELQKERLKEFYREKIRFLEKEIERYQQKIEDEKKKERTVLSVLKNIDYKITKLNLEIEKLSYEIDELEEDIETTKMEIEQIEKKMKVEKELIKKLLVNFYEIKRDFSVIKTFFSGKSFSNIFANLSYLEQLQQRLYIKSKELRDLKNSLQEKLDNLNSQKEELNQLKILNYVQKRELANRKKERERILFEIEQAKKSYKNIIEATKLDIEKIKRQLYILEGVGVKMSFEQAYKYAKFVEKNIGVRAAFLLALLKKESEWGANIGKGNWKEDLYDCYISLGKISRAEKEKQAFLKIVNELKLNPSDVPVSKAPSYGCGGALGPAQFLPSVWLSYKERVSKITGNIPPSPFDFKDAITAAGLKLKDLGAGARTWKAEWQAAQKYFAGSRWRNPRYYFYGNSIMELAEIYQRQIDILEKGS